MQEFTGLTSAEAARRAAQNPGAAPTITRSIGQIVRKNVCTLFNLLNFIIAVLLFSVHAYSNMAFFAIILLNTGIGIAQELKAKKLVDELSILNRPRATVLRDGSPVELPAEQLVQDDVILLESGRQICNDSVVLSGQIDVNESLLTGESDSIVKKPGDTLLSGSFVVGGSSYARVTHVGAENYAAALTAEVKQEKQTDSELLGSMRKVTHFTSFLILPMGVLLLAEALFLRGATVETAVVSSAAALLGMLPKGLVLLISVSLAMGVQRLAKKKILVQNLFALETLAHVDVLCLDKTGTITDYDGNIRPRARETLDYFERQGMTLKVISGDKPEIVRQVAQEAGLTGWNKVFDLSTVDEKTADYASICEEYTFFSRCTPRNKQMLVKALQQRGHKVAMTGDGVNDLLALRQADCSIAVAEGSDASRQLAQIVLLASDFTHLPQVVEEGRRVIHNVTRTAGVFFIKTIYSLLLSVFCLATNMPFPFIPLQITLIDAVIEAFPSFASIFEADIRPVHGRFLPTALGNALPFALVATSTILFAAFFTPFDGTELQTIQYLLLVAFSLAAVVKSCIPFTPLRINICAVCILGMIAALVVCRRLLGLAVMSVPMLFTWAALTAMGMVILFLLLYIQHTVQESGKKQTAGQPRSDLRANRL